MIDKRVEKLEQQVTDLINDIHRIESDLCRAVAKMEVFEILQEVVDADRDNKDSEIMEEGQ